ncbi:adult-specific cuticular protein ACP-22, partial [Neocloeon triangulifer]|uniref:adult-specific cuticular protein ACP-22 n=1 Tax=Neocloeon triangulifer TaxID=2078957 RepID=UPI00286F5CB1
GGGAGGGGGGSGGEGKFYHDIFLHWKAPDQVEFGHIAESPSDWEQRFEKKDGHRHQGKVRWGDKKGGHGEHLWDYNHDGHDGHDGGN